MTGRIRCRSDGFVAASHLVDLRGRCDERFAELPHVVRAAERDAVVAALSDIDVPINLTFRRLSAPDLDFDVAGTGRRRDQ